MERLTEISELINQYVWGIPMIVLILGTHIFLTIRLRFPQRSLITAIRLSIKRDSQSEGDVSPFAALATSLAATIGTGNIIGVATAIACGGPGAVLWCWLTGIFGISTKYAEGLLAMKYREKNEKGEMIGGPMYALEKGLNAKWLAKTFCVFTATATFGLGCTVPSNAIATLNNSTLNIPVEITGVILAIAIGCVLLFGIKGIAKACVPLTVAMTILYIFGCIYILIINAEFLGETLRLIVTSAFTPQAAGGGFVGSSVMLAARYGIARGLYSNESGMGSAPILAAAAQSRNPVRQALISSTSTFWDTVIVSALTGLVLVSCIIANPEVGDSNGATLAKSAFSMIPHIGAPLLAFGILTFSFSTILGWSYYGEKAIEYLGGLRFVKIYRLALVVMIYVGAVSNLSFVWNFADTANALMALPNIVSLLLLSGVVVRETRYFLWEDRLDEIDTRQH